MTCSEKVGQGTLWWGDTPRFLYERAGELGESEDRLDKVPTLFIFHHCLYSVHSEHLSEMNYAFVLTPYFLNGFVCLILIQWPSP